MAEVPTWFRALTIIFGLIMITLSIGLWFWYGVATALIVILLAIGLSVIGVDFLIRAGLKDLPAWRRAVSVVLGIIIIIAAIWALIQPSFGVTLAIVLLGIGLLISGLTGLISGLAGADMPGWQRAISIIFGILIIILAIVVLINPTPGYTIYIGFIPYFVQSAGYFLLILLLSLSLLIRGIQSVYNGIVAKP